MAIGDDNPYKIAGDILSASSVPDGGFSSVDLYGSSVQEKNEGSMCSVFHLENESGTGDIMVYQAFPGMELVYNDMHMEYCNKIQNPCSGVIEINYCREGRCECAFGEQSYCYMAAGDLSICSLQRRAHISLFPTSHYHGITVTIDFAGITEEMRKILELLSVDLTRISEFSGRQDFHMVRANETVQHIFSELYTVQEHMKLSYIKVKLMELLLMLTELDFSAGKTDYVYFAQAQRDCIRKIHDFVVEHITEHILSALLGCQGMGEYQNMLYTALRTGIDPIAIKEVIYQAMAYIGIGRTYDFHEIDFSILHFLQNI